MSKNLIICDLDGTIANIEHRLHYLKGPKKDWDSFTKACVDDEPYKDVIAILDSLALGMGNGCNVCGAVEREFYFFSGRSEVVRKETEEWLKKHVPITEDRDWELYMRKEGDFRNDVEVKREMIHSLNITPDDVLCILDDRQGVVDMWREEGFRCLQVDAWKEEPKRHHLMDKAQLPRVYYHSWMTGPQGARFEIFKSNHSTEVINETKKRLRYDQDVVKIYVVDGEPEDYDHKKERLEFYDIEENDNG